MGETWTREARVHSESRQATAAFEILQPQRFSFRKMDEFRRVIEELGDHGLGTSCLKYGSVEKYLAAMSVI